MVEVTEPGCVAISGVGVGASKIGSDQADRSAETKDNPPYEVRGPVRHGVDHLSPRPGRPH